MALMIDNNLSTNFSGLSQIQCLGTNYLCSTYPNGVATRAEIVNGWAKFTLADSDADTFGGKRTEVVTRVNALNDECWYTVEFMINEADWSDAGECSIMQIHPEDSIASPVSFILIVKNGMLIMRNQKTNPPTLDGTYSTNIIPLIPFVFGKVYQVCLHSKWTTSDGTGFLELFIDKTPVYRTWGRATAYVGDTPYMKFGIYDHAHAGGFGTKIAYFRNYKEYVGGTYSYADIMGSLPNPVPHFSNGS